MRISFKKSSLCQKIILFMNLDFLPIFLRVHFLFHSLQCRKNHFLFTLTYIILLCFLYFHCIYLSYLFFHNLRQKMYLLSSLYFQFSGLYQNAWTIYVYLHDHWLFFSLWHSFSITPKHRSLRSPQKDRCPGCTFSLSISFIPLFLYLPQHPQRLLPEHFPHIPC